MKRSIADYSSKSYKPEVVPHMLKVIHSRLELKKEEQFIMSSSIDKKSEIKRSSTVLVVANLQESIEYYQNLGFLFEDIGGHAHLTRGKACFILHPAKNPSDVRPASSLDGGLYFDAFCYTDAVALYGEFKDKGVIVVRGPNSDEFTIKDINGYQITFGRG